jgi:uncharacterized membrane protein YgdD (TMEM256/DUF423 family)
MVVFSPSAQTYSRRIQQRGLNPLQSLRSPGSRKLYKARALLCLNHAPALIRCNMVTIIKIVAIAVTTSNKLLGCGCAAFAGSRYSERRQPLS